MVKITKYAALFAIPLVQALNETDEEFLTRLVDDVKSNVGQYVGYMITGNVPADITSAAAVIRTYDGTDYESLISAENIDVTSLEEFAASLPWASRLGITNVESSSNTPSSSSSTAGSQGSIKISSFMLLSALTAAIFM